MNENRKINFTILDSIRGIAALYVVIGHCRGLLWMGGSKFMEVCPIDTWSVGDYAIFGISMTTRLAVEFVIVFFVLSGFSIAHSVSRSKSNSGFFKRRFIRLYPPYIMALIWAGLVAIIARYLQPDFFNGILESPIFERYAQMNDFFESKTIVSNLVYMPSKGFITPFWSLTYEVIFYLVAPILLLKRNFKFYFIGSVCLWILGLILPELILKTGVAQYFTHFLFVYNIYFAIGAFLYHHFEVIEKIFFKLFFNKKLEYSFLALAALVMFGLNLFNRGEHVSNFFAAATLSVGLVLVFLKNNVELKGLIWIGGFSYTLYITHLATIFLYHVVLHTYFGFNPPYIEEFWVFLPAIILCVVVAYIWYILVERNTQLWLKGVRKKTYKN